jgi:hypothetical protein
VMLFHGVSLVGRFLPMTLAYSAWERVRSQSGNCKKFVREGNPVRGE